MRKALLMTLVVLGAVAHAAEVKIGPRGQVSVNGKPVIPRGVWSQPTYLFEYYRHLGLNCIVAVDEEPLQFHDYQRAFEAAAANKLGLVVSGGRPGRATDDPNLWGRLAGVIPKDSSWIPGYYGRLRREQPGHLMMVNIAIRPFLRGEDARLYPEALKNADAVISHVWPGCMKPDQPDIRNVAKLVDRVRELCKGRPGGEISIWTDINPHAWKLKDKEGGTAYPAPTREELRFQIWLALIHGADAICLFPITFDPFVYSQIPAGNEQEIAWNSRLMEKMTPALTGEESPLKMEVATDPKNGVVDWTTRTAGGRHYIFLVNGVYEEQKVRLAPPGLGTAWQLRDAVEDKDILVASGEYSEKLPGLALRIWELVPAPAR